MSFLSGFARLSTLVVFAASVSFAGAQATPTVTVSAVSIPSGASPTTLTATITFTMTLYPNGAFTFQVDSGTTVTASCSGTTSPRTCTASYATGSLSVGSHTITGVLAADSNYVTQTATNTLTVQGGYIWLVNASGSLAELTTSGAAVNSGAIGTTTGNASTLGGVAIDGTSHVWSVSNANNTLGEMTTAGGSVHALPVAGLSAPVAVAIDGENDAWVANSGNGTVSIYGPATANLTAGANYGSSYETGVAMQTPSAIAIDFTGGVWVANKAGNSVTHIIGGAFPTVTPIAAATAAGTQGVEP